MSLKSALSAAKKKYGITVPTKAVEGAAEPAPCSTTPPVIDSLSNPAAGSTQGSLAQEEDTPPATSISSLVVVEVLPPSVDVAPSTNALPSPLKEVATTTTTKAPQATSAAGVLLRPKRSRGEGNGSGEGPIRPKFGKDDVIAFMAKVKATQPKI